jgi:hypothetical protein
MINPIVFGKQSVAKYIDSLQCAMYYENEKEDKAGIANSLDSSLKKDSAQRIR